jgi:hypothetical protein
MDSPIRMFANELVNRLLQDFNKNIKIINIKESDISITWINGFDGPKYINIIHQNDKFYINIKKINNYNDINLFIRYLKRINILFQSSNIPYNLCHQDHIFRHHH